MDGARAFWVAAAAGLLGLAAAAYLPWAGNPFHFDDRECIVEDWTLRDLDALLQNMRTNWIRAATRLSFWAVLSTGGQDARAFHLACGALHVAGAFAVGALAWGLLRREPALGGAWGAPGAALAAGGCFLLHPLNSEAALYISSFPDLLGTLFALGAAWSALAAFEAWRGGRSRSALAWAAGGIALNAAATLSKESAAMGLFLGLLLAGWRLRGDRAWLRRWGWVLLAAASGMLLLVRLEELRRGLSPGGLLRGDPHPPFAYPEHLSNQVRVHAWYLLPRLLFPVHLNLSPGRPCVPAAWPEALELGILLLAGLSALAVRWCGRGGWRSLAALAWGWWVLAQAGTTLPVLSDPVFEHRAYLAMVLPCVLGGALLSRAARAFTVEGAGPWGGALLAAVAGLFALRDHARGADFRSELSLWTAVVRDAPGKSGAWLNLGRSYDEETGNLRCTARNYNRALRQATPGFQAMILNNVGNVQIRQQNFAEAVRTFDFALDLSPGHPDIRMNRGIALVHAGRAGEGLAEFESLLQEQPWNGDLHRALGNLLLGRKDVEGARTHFREACRLSPDLADAAIDLAWLEIQEGNPEEAVRVMERAAARSAFLPRIWDGLGVACHAAGDLPRAEAAARKALSMDPRMWRPHVTLAGVAMRRGDPDAALAEYRAALALAPDHPQLREKVARLSGQAP